METTEMSSGERITEVVWRVAREIEEAVRGGGRRLTELERMRLRMAGVLAVEQWLAEMCVGVVAAQARVKADLARELTEMLEKKQGKGHRGRRDRGTQRV